MDSQNARIDAIDRHDFRPRLLMGLIAASVIIFITLFISYRYYFSTVTDDLSRYLDTVHLAERACIEHLPLYEDFATPAMELKLRTHLFPDHMAEALKSGLPPIERDSQIRERIAAGTLVRLESGPDAPYFFYNVRKDYRALPRATACGLSLITDRFRKNMALRAELPPVKIALSSVLRPAPYQADLRSVNPNATPATTHSYGVSFDIFYDDFYVSLPAPHSSNGISRAVLDTLRRRLGFLLGDALRSQFRSMLLETLIQLQDEGVIYAILEQRQHCYHVTVRGNPSCVTSATQ
jgi:hypothetical protein